MDFWEARNDAALRAGFGAQRLIMSSKSSIIATNRPNSSLTVVQGKSRLINPNEAISQSYQESGTRYIFAKDLTFDLFISLYDVNSLSVVVLRATAPLNNVSHASLKRQISKFSHPNLEMRAIGMQNNDTTLIKVLDEVHSVCRCKLIELDLFGNEKRHVAVDLKTGLSYDVLLLDRIYRPGEKANDVTPDAFKKSVSELKFV